MSEVRRSPAPARSRGKAPRGANAGTRRIAPPDTDTELRAAAAPRRPEPEPGADRVTRRAVFLAELAEARELRKRVAPRRVRAAELHVRLLRTYRY